MNFSPAIWLAWKMAAVIAERDQTLIEPHHFFSTIFSLVEQNESGQYKSADTKRELDELTLTFRSIGLELGQLLKHLQGPVEPKHTGTMPAAPSSRTGAAISRSEVCKRSFDYAAAAAHDESLTQADLRHLVAGLLVCNKDLSLALGIESAASNRLIASLVPKTYTLSPQTLASSEPRAIFSEPLVKTVGTDIVLHTLDADAVLESEINWSIVGPKFATLCELAWEAGASGSVGTLLQSLIERILSFIPRATHGAILILDPLTGDLDLKAHAPRGNVSLSRSSAQQALDEKKAFIWQRRQDLSKTQFESHLESGVYAPVIADGKSFGVICLNTKSAASRLTQEDLFLAASLGHQIGLVLANRSLKAEIAEKISVLERMMTNFSPQVRTHLIQRAQEGRLRLGGHRSNVSILCADIRGFTIMAATMDCDDLLLLLNDYFAVMVESVFRHDGTIDKFIGDALLAVFGSPDSYPRHAEQAAKAAITMQAATQAVSERRRSKGETACEIGIGVHTGEVIHGFIGSVGRTTHYADRVYDTFGAHSLKSLMRNLAELDWRKGQTGETGLNLLDTIWADINTRFRNGDEYARHSILGELEPAAIYQPVQVLGLIRTAIDAPVVLEEGGEGSGYRLGQSYVVTALPGLLEGTAYHPEHIRESVGLLWRLSKGEHDRNSTGSSARTVLKRLASWRRYTDAAFNFAMLLQAIRLMSRPDAFTEEYTPFDIIRQLLEKDGEFTEWQDETTMSFGGFGLNYAAVGPVRRSALDYLDFALAGDGILAIQSIAIMENLLHNYLNRMRRASSPEEKTWQNAERARCIDSLLSRYEEPASDVLKGRIFDALRSATAISCPDWVRGRISAALEGLDVPDAVVVVDAISTADHELPFLSTAFSEPRWESAITDVMVKGRSSLERLVEGSGNQARFTLEKTKACLAVRVATGGFHRFMLTFVDRPDFLEVMADDIIRDEEIKQLSGQLASVLNAIHISRPEVFRRRALAAIDAGASEVIHAAANNLRVFSGATEEDIAVIQAYAGYPDPVAKLGAVFAITYMGKFTDLLPALKEAVLSVRTEGDSRVAAELADAFGPYGVPLTILTRDEATGLVREFALVSDWDCDQGAIPRFLNHFVSLFPDEMFEVLTERIKKNSAARTANLPRLRTFGLVYGDVSFSSVPTEKRMELAAKVLRQALMPETGEEASDLFWDVAGINDSAFDLILRDAPGISEDSLRQLVALLDKAAPRLAFNKPQFVKELLKSFHGAARQKVIDTIAYQSYRRGGGAFAGDPTEMMAKEQQSFRDAVGALAEDPELDDLLLAMRRFL